MVAIGFRPACAAAACAAALALTACSGGEDTPAPESTSDAATTQPETSQAATGSSDDASYAIQEAKARERLEKDLQLIEGTVECLREQGWDVEFDRDERSYSAPAGGVPEEQYDAWQASQEQCAEQFAHLVEEPMGSKDDPRWREHYDHQLFLAECLRREGYDVEDPPTFEAWRDAALADEEWTAWQQLPTIGQAEYRRLSEACPQ